MKIRPPKPKKRPRSSKNPSKPIRSHRVKIPGRLTLEQLSLALQMAVARMEERGHDEVRSVYLYYRPADPQARVENDAQTIEIRLAETDLRDE